jgi:hypothetical protein
MMTSYQVQRSRFNACPELAEWVQSQEFTVPRLIRNDEPGTLNFEPIRSAGLAAPKENR